MSLYTIILDFKGGTYVSQFNENNEEFALQQWIKTLDDNLSELAIDDRNAFLKDEDSRLSPLLDLQNVWCATFVINDSLALINVIKTKAI